MDTERRKTMDSYITTLEPSQAAILTTIRALVREAGPELRETFKWAQPVWELNGPVCYLKAFRTSTNFGFWRGVELKQRFGAAVPLTGDGAMMRHLKLATVADIPAEPLKELLRAAVELNQRFGDPTKGEATRAR